MNLALINQNLGIVGVSKSHKWKLRGISCTAERVNQQADIFSVLTISQESEKLIIDNFLRPQVLVQIDELNITSQ